MMTPERRAELRPSPSMIKRFQSSADLNECLDEIDRLHNVLKLTDEECLSGGFANGLAFRPYTSLDGYDRKMLVVAGKCIARILNRQEAK
jgi:hypothetical protein